MDMFCALFGEQVHFVNFYSCVAFLSYKIDFEQSVLLFPLDLCRPRWVALCMYKNQSALFEILHN